MDTPFSKTITVTAELADLKIFCHWSLLYQLAISLTSFEESISREVSFVTLSVSYKNLLHSKPVFLEICYDTVLVAYSINSSSFVPYKYISLQRQWLAIARNTTYTQHATLTRNNFDTRSKPSLDGKWSTVERLTNILARDLNWYPFSVARTCANIYPYGGSNRYAA